MSADDRACGLNAQWCVQAWHLGPARWKDDWLDGDFYLLDGEDGAYYLVRRFDEENEEGNETIPLLGKFKDFDEGLAEGIKIADKAGYLSSGVRTEEEIRQEFNEKPRFDHGPHGNH